MPITSVKRTRFGQPVGVVAASALLASFCVATLSQAQVATPLDEPSEVAAEVLADSMGRTRVIVVFDEAPVTRMRPNVQLHRASRSEMRDYAGALRSRKAGRLAAIRGMGGRIQNTTEYTLNAAIVDVHPSQIARIAALPGVARVQRAGVYYLQQSTPANPPTVPELIRTAQVNAAGNRGAGVAIAIIDSGVDYTHAAFNRTTQTVGLGATGTTSLYQAAVSGNRPTIIGDTDGLFPATPAQVAAGPATAPQVIGGYDWVGETWPNGPVTPDPDPIDNLQVAADFAGHGTNSASAAAGQGSPSGQVLPGSAPGAWLLAYRGCSRVSSACEGSALLNSVESAVRYAAGDPNFGQPGANNPALPQGTRLVINMSLGAGYGNPLIDDLSEASRNAVRAGVTVVASAGNGPTNATAGIGGNAPFITGTPGSTDMVIGVAATQPATLTGPTLSVGAPLNATYPLIPGSFGVQLNQQASFALALAGPNAPPGVNLACSGTGTGTGTPGPAVPAVPAAVAGAIGIADRGTCGFNEKAFNIQRAGGAVALIVNNAPGAGPLGMAAGPAPMVTQTTIPSYSIGTAEGAAVKVAAFENPGLAGTISPLGTAANAASGINLVDAITEFSSRGPVQNFSALKPDIAAPGANVFVAEIGTGTRGEAVSGTSFSSPYTAGVAALVLSANPSFTPWQVKAALMNTANPTVFASKTTSTTGALTALARSGAGRVDAEAAVSTRTLAYDPVDIDPTSNAYFNTGVSFGPLAFTSAGTATASREIEIRNLDASEKTYSVSVAPRFVDDLAKGVSFSPSTGTVTVPGNSTARVTLTATVVGAQLPRRTVSGFSVPNKLLLADSCYNNAACPAKFDNLEQDGFVTISAGPNDTVRVPYLMYPRAASSVTGSRFAANIITRNTGGATTFVDVFNLLGTVDPKDMPPTVPGQELLNSDIKEIGLRYSPGVFAGQVAAAPNGDLLEIAVSLWDPVSTPRQAIFNVELDVNGDAQADFRVQNLSTATGTNSVFITALPSGAPGNAFFGTTGEFNSGKFVLPFFPQLAGIANAGQRIGIRVYTSTFLGDPPSLGDSAPNGGGFLYVTPNRLVNVPSARSYVQLAGTPSPSAARFAFTSSAANLAASPGDKGLLLFYGDNAATNETQAFQLVP